MTSDKHDTAAIGGPEPRRRAVRSEARPALRTATVSAAVYRDLRGDILALRRPPGAPIAEKQISEAYGVSRTPVREAVLKLADEGLVEIYPQSGTFVARIPLAALPEAITIRRVLEEAVARFAAERATRSQVARLRASLEAQRERAAAGDRDGFHKADEEFHALLADISGYPGFWTLVNQVKVQVDRYRRLTLPLTGRMAEVVVEHEAVVDAIAAGDPEAAAAALKAHLTHLEISIADTRDANPQYFSAIDTDPAR